eukprot:g3373.t1
MFLGLAASALCVGSAEAAGNAEVFDLWTKLKSFEYTVMLTIVIVGLVLFDQVVETYEHYLHHHKGRFHRSLFKKAVKELMILGLISFVLFLIKDQRLIDLDDDIVTNTFDFVNLFLFFVGVSFVLAAVLIVNTTAPLKTRWDTYANVPLERLLQLHKEMVTNSWKWYLAWPPRYFMGLRQAQVIEYHLFRSVFLRLNRSLLTPAFDYSKYSGAIVNELILEYYDVGWGSWLLAVVVLFFTVPITTSDDGSEAVSAHGAIIFGFVLVGIELLVCGFISYAHQKVTARMGAVGGFKGVGKVLEELWVEPQHHFGQETSAIDVKDLLKSAPVNAAGVGASAAEVNFKVGRGSSSSTASMRRANGSANSSTHGIVDSSRATTSGATAASATSSSSSMRHSSSSGGSLNLLPPVVQPSSASTAVAAPDNGESPEMEELPAAAGSPSAETAWDPLYLPPGRVQNCAMGGDPFVLAVLRPPQSVVDRLPEVLKGFDVKVGSFRWFQALLGMSVLLKCYYSAFYFSYAIGRATVADAGFIVLWAVFVPVPLAMCLLPLAKRTVPIFAQLACLQGPADERGSGCDGEGRPSALSRAIDDLFGEWDTDGDNNITKDELSRGLANHGVYLSSIQMRELFRLADPDHSKSIDPAEFRNFLSDLQPEENEPARFSKQLSMRLQRCSLPDQIRSRVPRLDDCKLLGTFSARGEAAAGQHQQHQHQHQQQQQDGASGTNAV